MGVLRPLCVGARIRQLPGPPHGNSRIWQILKLAQPRHHMAVLGHRKVCKITYLCGHCTGANMCQHCQGCSAGPWQAHEHVCMHHQVALLGHGIHDKRSLCHRIVALAHGRHMNKRTHHLALLGLGRHMNMYTYFSR